MSRLLLLCSSRQSLSLFNVAERPIVSSDVRRDSALAFSYNSTIATCSLSLFISRPHPGLCLCRSEAIQSPPMQYWILIGSSDGGQAIALLAGDLYVEAIELPIDRITRPPPSVTTMTTTSLMAALGSYHPGSWWLWSKRWSHLSSIT